MTAVMCNCMDTHHQIDQNIVYVNVSKVVASVPTTDYCGTPLAFMYYWNGSDNALTQGTVAMDLLLIFDVVDNHRFGDMNERVVEYGRTSSFTEERDLSSSATIDNV